MINKEREGKREGGEGREGHYNNERQIIYRPEKSSAIYYILLIREENQYFPPAVCVVE